VNSIIWVVAVIVLNAVIAGIAKKAQANAEAARRANAAGAGASGGIAGGASRGVADTLPGASAPPTSPPTSPPPSPTEVAFRTSGAMSSPAPGTASNATASVTVVRTPRAPKVIARGNLKPAKPLAGAGAARATATKKPNPKPVAPAARGGAFGTSPTPTPPPDALRGGDTAQAMLSRQRLTAAVAKVKAAESRISAPQTGHDLRTHAGPKQPRPTGATALAKVRAPVGVTAAELSRMLRDPSQIRRALVLGEVFGRPRSERPI
jgi:hypothetical protein